MESKPEKINKYDNKAADGLGMKLKFKKFKIYLIYLKIRIISFYSNT